MSGDYSRFTDRPRARFSAVRMQQGRVQLDADWNEEVAILKRRWETQALDTFGPAAVPEATTPNGFAVALAPPDDLALGAGRIYVHGKLAEIFEGETVGGDPVSYLHQPFLPEPPPLPGGNYVVYLDLWDREVTYLEDPQLLEKALGGPDTATRLQTVWQVKVQETADQGTEPAECGLPVGEPASTGRLSTRAVAPPTSDDPCILSPTGGYRGIENRLYRVEIHDSDSGSGVTRWKWSRENASVASAVTGIGGAGTELAVHRIGRDQVLRFEPDGWVEVTDDLRELAGLPGQMVQVKTILESPPTLILHTAVAGFGTTADEHAARHTRVRRWDQTEGVDADGLLTVGAPWVPLEVGVEVQFGAGTFHTGDSWSFAARTVDGSVEVLDAAPPQVIHHVYCQLAAVNGAEVDDCRPLWPDCECGCCCTIEVGDGTLSHGDFDDLVAAVQSVSQANRDPRDPVVICLLPGTHILRETVVVARDFVTVRGCGRAARVIGPQEGPAFAVSGRHIHLEDLFVTTRGEPAVVSRGTEALRIRGSEMQHFSLTQDDRGFLDTGLVVLESGTVEARIESNLIGPGRGHGIALAVASQESIVLAGNDIRGMVGCGIASVATRATRDEDDDLFLTHVALRARSTPTAAGPAGQPAVDRFRIVLPTPGRIDDLRIEHNEIVGCVGTLARPRTGAADLPFGGIVLGRVDHLAITDNRIVDNGSGEQIFVPVAGIFVRDGRGLLVRDNVVTGNGPAPGGENIAGPQGGILGEDLSVVIESLAESVPNPLGFDPVPTLQPDGWPAASVHGNLVVAPRGLALSLTGVGPMPVTDNRLTARDVRGAFGAVLIFNLGLPAYITRQAMAQGFPASQPPALPTDPTQLAHNVLGGKIDFSNNQVALDLARLEAESALAAVGILTLDDLGFHDNQTECTLVGDVLFVDTLLIATTLRATGNGFTESLFGNLISLWAAGFFLCTGTSNQGTHCIKVECLTPQLVNDHNLHLLCPEQLDALRFFR